MTPRLVVDFSHPNCIIELFQFQIVIITQVHLPVRLGAWFFTLELENAYWHIPINQRYRHFLVVEVGDTVLQFTILPFSLNIMPQVMMKSVA